MSDYVAPWWLPDGHSQTVFPAFFVSTDSLSYQRERWATPDQDFIDLDWVNDTPQQIANHAPLLVLFHGLEGSSHSHYARALMHAVTAWGWLGVVPHFRSCSGEINAAPRFYHSGDATEIDWILQALHQRHPQRPIYVVGVSLGGNALLRFLGETGRQSTCVHAAAAISAPLDLNASGNALSSGWNLLYTYAFLRSLKRKCLEKLNQYPGLFDRQAMLSSHTLYAFDNVVTAPLHGYRDVQDYWQRASCLNVLSNIRVPTLILNARNDPFLPGKYLPAAKNVSSSVVLQQPKQGGHVGFLHGRFPGQLDWLPQYLYQFFQGENAYMN